VSCLRRKSLASRAVGSIRPSLCLPNRNFTTCSISSARLSSSSSNYMTLLIKTMYVSLFQRVLNVNQLTLLIAADDESFVQQMRLILGPGYSSSPFIGLKGTSIQPRDSMISAFGTPPCYYNGCDESISDSFDLKIPVGCTATSCAVLRVLGSVYTFFQHISELPSFVTCTHSQAYRPHFLPRSVTT
jgi:hypothetical protein